MRRIICVIALVLLAVGLVAGCGNHPKQAGDWKNGRMELVSGAAPEDYAVLRDRETGRLYLFVVNGFGAGLCPMEGN